MLAIRENSKRSRSNYPVETHSTAHHSVGPGHLADFFGGFGGQSVVAGNPFASMERMMNRMTNMAEEMFSGFSQMSHMRPDFVQSSAPGSFYSSTLVQSTKFDANGRPVVEKYRSEAKGGVNERGEVMKERKQAYAHSGTGLEKYGHERAIGDKGRKVVKERFGDQERTMDVFKNLVEREVEDFDRQWRNAWGGSALPGPSGNMYGRGPVVEERKIDDERRGDFIPNNWRSENRPARRNDLQPTVPVNRGQPAIAQAPNVRRNPVRVTRDRRTPAAGA